MTKKKVNFEISHEIIVRNGIIENDELFIRKRVDGYTLDIMSIDTKDAEDFMGELKKKLEEINRKTDAQNNWIINTKL